MNGPGDSLRIDALALALLDELLDLDAPSQHRRLQDLASTDPALHERVQRLLSAGRAGADSLRWAADWALPQAQPEPGLQPGDQVAGYSLIRALGQGGMASVWLAERTDGGLKREVALKLPLAATAMGALAERFARERDVLAALDHPNIARLFDAGVDRGRPYIVLEHVDGQPLTAWADAHGLGRAPRIQLFLQVLAAVDHAHQHMVVHRDLKPGNILVDAQGCVKLLDFGIAKLLGPATGGADLTQEAGSIFTPRYAAPEQLLGQPVTAASDVHAAGVVLYELLTGRWPYALPGGTGPDRASVGTLVQAVLQGTPQPAGLSTDLDTVLAKTLARAPEQRYRSVERLADDLRRVLDKRPIQARRVPAWERALLWTCRHPRVAWGGTLAAALVLASSALAWAQWRESAAQRERADVVRQFVFAMLADAEPAEGKADVSGSEMLDAAVARVRREVAAPRLRGELLGALGHVYLRLARGEAARNTLTEAVALLEGQAPKADTTLNGARADLAQAVNDQDTARGAALAQQVLRDCVGVGGGCAQARATAHFVLSAHHAWSGRAADALVHARASVREAEAGDGARSLELVTALEVWATSARNHGHVMEAQAALLRAVGLAAGRAMRAARRDRLELVQARVDADLGRFDAAWPRVQQLLQRTASGYERSAQWRVLSAIELARGQPQAAIAAAAAAVQVLPAALAASSPQAWLARQAWGRAASHSGRHAEALAALTQAHAGLLAQGFPPEADLALAAQRDVGEALLRQGQLDAARATLAAVQAAHAGMSDPNPIEWALAADALACALARTGEQTAAAAMSTQAAAQWASALPAEHPAVRRSRDLLAAQDCSDRL